MLHFCKNFFDALVIKSKGNYDIILKAASTAFNYSKLVRSPRFEVSGKDSGAGTATTVIVKII
jgi:hypothetical protein